MRLYIFIGLWIACVLGGCTGAIYTGSGTYDGNPAISQKALWRLQGDVADPAAATDNDVGTVATMRAGASSPSVTLDLSKPCVFNQIVIDHGSQPMGFCRHLSVQTSYDGKNFTPVYVATGTRRITYVPMMTPTIARYIRLQVTVSGSEPLALAEIYLQ